MPTTTNLASATVSISGGFFAGDTLNFTNQNGITGSYNSGTGVLTLTGSATVANYQTALHSITFSSTSDNPTNFGADTSRTITWMANDGTVNSTAATSTVNVTAVNDAPVVTAGATVGYTEQGTAVVLDSGLTVSDADKTTSGERHGVDQLGLPRRRHAELHQPERHHRQLQQRHRRAHPDRQRHGRPTTRRRCDSITFSSTSDNPTNFGADTSRTITWTVERRRPQQHGRHQHGEHHGGRRCAGRDGGSDGRASPRRARRSCSMPA